MISYVNRKSMEIRYSGRSSDFISPSFEFGCLYQCSYCYMKRHLPRGLNISRNVGDIITSINNHATFTTIDKPNQTDPEYITYDISCNSDFALHNKYHNWKYIFSFFKNHPRAKATFATKYIPKEFLEFNPEKKVRIRFSLMPQNLSSVFEPNTTKILDRIKAVDTFIEAGYDVHLNFSPVIVYKNWLKDYRKLFEYVDKFVTYKDQVKAEVILLTHNKNKHMDNLRNNVKGESMLWVPKLQETKTSEYGGINVRYKRNLKAAYIKQFKQLHSEIIPWNFIRYIF